MKCLMHKLSNQTVGRPSAAFTIPEVVMAIGLAGLLGAVFAIFTEATGRTLSSLMAQSLYNQSAGNGAEFIISRIRLANSATIDDAGGTARSHFPLP